ncbi:OLC1v1036932C1 [Oldenlandia corymbosa var. corymbosa]|uniref:OLC1v1036932C1 n=1 Tax=Oldenlandia corymbosa var. corymbosa TaxID=529605 RepID=A0AAV1CWK1_OLDCO|nr:OLC1v1036932C1 [Oldenlandia corymbosa var. corymbosa]
MQEKKKVLEDPKHKKADTKASKSKFIMPKPIPKWRPRVASQAGTNKVSTLGLSAKEKEAVAIDLEGNHKVNKIIEPAKMISTSQENNGKHEETLEQEKQLAVLQQRAVREEETSINPDSRKLNSSLYEAQDIFSDFVINETLMTCKEQVLSWDDGHVGRISTDENEEDICHR